MAIWKCGEVVIAVNLCLEEAKRGQGTLDEESNKISKKSNKIKIIVGPCKVLGGSRASAEGADTDCLQDSI